MASQRRERQIVAGKEERFVFFVFPLKPSFGLSLNAFSQWQLA